MAPQKYAVLGGLTLGATEPGGVRWAMPRLEGSGSPDSSIQLVTKPRGHGAWAGTAYMNARHIVMSGTCSAPTPAALLDARRRLTEACSLDDQLLTVHEWGESWWCMARREGLVIFDDVTPLFAKWSIQMVAVDPRKLGAPITQSTRLPSSTGGLTIPFTIPFSINSTQVTGQVSIVNPGNETGPVTMRLDGPITGPVITHVGSGLRLTFAASATLGAGEFWLIDMEAQSVLAQGQVTRAQYITSRQWSGFEPGVNVWALTAASYSPTALLTITATPADK